MRKNKGEILNMKEDQDFDNINMDVVKLPSIFKNQGQFDDENSSGIDLKKQNFQKLDNESDSSRSFMED